MAIRIHRSLRTHIAENKEFVLQVQKASDLEAATSALRRAAEDVGALDGGWDSAFGLSPGDTNGPTAVRVILTPSGPLMAVDGGHTPDELLITIPRLVARRLEAAGVTNAVVAPPKRSETLIHLARVPRAVVLRLFLPPHVHKETDGLGDSPRVPSRWLEEACTWLTTGLGDDHQLWALMASMEFGVPAADAVRFLHDHRGLLVAGNPPTPAPTKRAKAEGWTDEQVVADSVERIGGRLRVATASGSGLTLAAGGPHTTDDELLDAFADLRTVARRLAPEVGYGFITFSARITLTDELSLRWSPEAPQSWPHRNSDVVVFDAFPAQILGPGHIQRLGGVPAGATELEGGRFELTIGESRSWLESPRERGRVLLDPCLIGDRREVQLRTYQRYEASMRSAPVDAAELNRILWQFLRKPARPMEELLADPEMVPYFKMALRHAREAVSAPVEEPEFVTRGRARSQHIGQFTSQLHNLHRPVSLHLYPPPPTTIGMSAQLPTWVLQGTGAWVAEGEPAEMWAISGLDRFRIDSIDAPSFLPYCFLVALHHDGRVRIGGAGILGGRPEPAEAATGVSLTAGRLHGHALPIGSPAADEEVLGLVDALSALARSVAPDLGYAFVTVGGWNGMLETVVPTDLIDEFVFDAFLYQVLGPGHLERLGILPPGALPIVDGKVGLSIGDPVDWLPSVQDAGRKILARCLVTASEDRAMSNARDVAIVAEQ